MPDLIGTTLGPYRILEQIGFGGMATVYKAYQASMDRMVAVKIVSNHLAHDRFFYQRFEQEARVIAKLEHPHIVPVYDFGKHDDIAYLAMRYLQAGTLKDVLAHGPLPMSETVRVIADVAAGLDHAHQQGIVHRDVKPSNILVDKSGFAYLTDFGLAKVLETSLELTGSGAMLGTPAYMAPEQTLGRPVTPQTDVYSLGITLYELATGRPPFEGDTPAGVALMHVYSPLPPPRDINPAMAEAVASVIVKALAKDPVERYQSAGALAHALATANDTELGAPSTRLTELAGAIAVQKGEEEVTHHVRELLRRQETTERLRRLLRLAPWAIGGLIILLLAVGLFSFWSDNTRLNASAAQTATAVADLLQQLANAQTDVAAGGAEVQPTLQFLQTQAAGLGVGVTPSVSSSTPVVTPSLTRTSTATPTATPSASRTSTPTLIRTRTPTAPSTDTSTPVATSAPAQPPADTPVPPPPPTATQAPSQPPTEAPTRPPTPTP
jgi:tRNA A-37 threonylcarbamoyl transferase component Bud32